MKAKVSLKRKRRASRAGGREQTRLKVSSDWFLEAAAAACGRVEGRRARCGFSLAYQGQNTHTLTLTHMCVCVYFLFSMSNRVFVFLASFGDQTFSPKH